MPNKVSAYAFVTVSFLLVCLSCTYFSKKNLADQVTKISHQMDTWIVQINEMTIHANQPDMAQDQVQTLVDQLNKDLLLMDESQLDLQEHIRSLTSNASYDPIRSYYFNAYKTQWIKTKETATLAFQTLQSTQRSISIMVALDEWIRQLNQFIIVHNEWVAMINQLG